MIFGSPKRKNHVLSGSRHAQFENFFHIKTNIIFRGETVCSVSENRSDSDGKSEVRPGRSEMSNDANRIEKEKRF
jgi:hypothetical protein